MIIDQLGTFAQAILFLRWVIKGQFYLILGSEILTIKLSTLYEIKKKKRLTFLWLDVINKVYLPPTLGSWWAAFFTE